MIHRILVPLDVSAYATGATARACEIAKRHSASVTGLGVIDLPAILANHLPVHAALIPYTASATAKMKRDASRKLTAALDTFGETCDNAGIENEKLLLKGVPTTRVLEAAFFHDLVVTGLQTYFHFETRDDPDTGSLTEILSETITPVLAVPGPAHAHPFETVLVAFDGSANSMRTLRAFAAFAQPYDFEVTILTSDADREVALHHLDQAQAFLTTHGVRKVRTVSTSDPITEIVERDFVSWADLVVAGVHSRHRIKDFFVGSFTKFLIQSKQTAVFLGQ